MKRYTLTSPSYIGQINVLYGGEPPMLLYMDFMKCELSEEQLKFFKTWVPAYFTDLESFKQSFGKSKLEVVEEGYRVGFEAWWTRYNVKRNRARAEKVWSKLSEADHVNAFFKLQMYERHLMVNSWKSKAEPDTYLKNRYWDNDWKN